MWITKSLLVISKEILPVSLAKSNKWGVHNLFRPTTIPKGVSALTNADKCVAF
jgi:hypothetical protein